MANLSKIESIGTNEAEVVTQVCSYSIDSLCNLHVYTQHKAQCSGYLIMYRWAGEYLNEWSSLVDARLSGLVLFSMANRGLQRLGKKKERKKGKKERKEKRKSPWKIKEERTSHRYFKWTNMRRHLPSFSLILTYLTYPIFWDFFMISSFITYSCKLLRRMIKTTHQ